MKRKLIAFVCMAAIGLGTTGMVSASGNEVSSGSVTITDNMTTPRTKVDVGGGEWEYGTAKEGKYQKRAWSNYYHKTRYHASSVVLGNKENDSETYKPNTTSKASIVGSNSYVARAFWRHVK
ncbi:TPA: lactococcin 972 family bacteriocin [Clostridioides difficile]